MKVITKKAEKITRYHYSMDREMFLAQNQNIRDGLFIKRAERTIEGIQERVSQIPWGWINKDIYSDDVLKERIRHPEFRLYDLIDAEISANEPIGYIIVAPVEERLRLKYLYECPKNSVIEMENIALFPDNEGKKRGWSFFQLMMNDLIKAYDTVYWSQSSTNYPTLKEFYQRQGAKYLGMDLTDNFHTTPSLITAS